MADFSMGERTIRLSSASEARDLSSRYSHYLVAAGGDGHTAAYEIVPDRPMTIGRATDAELRLMDPGVSSHHASVIRAAALVTVEDMGSTNGTYVDGKKIEGPTELPVGSRLAVGRTVLRHELRNREEVERQSQVAEDLAAARRYVEALLPAPRTRGPVRTDWVFEPCAALAGDAFGTFDIDGDRVALFVIDVAGHGARSALHSVSVVNILRNRSLPGADFRDPASVLGRLNDAFPMEQHDRLFFTMWYGVYSARSRRLAYASAGHPAALLVQGRGLATLPLKTPGPPVGAFEGARYSTDEAAAHDGSRLYLFSDGVFEFVAKDGTMRTPEDFELLVAMGASEGVAESKRLFEAVIAASRSKHLDDDFSLLVATFGDR